VLTSVLIWTLLLQYSLDQDTQNTTHINSNNNNFVNINKDAGTSAATATGKMRGLEGPASKDLIDEEDVNSANVKDVSAKDIDVSVKEGDEYGGVPRQLYDVSEQECRHPGVGTCDFMTFHGVGGDHTFFQRQLQAVSHPKLHLWLNFYLCDEWTQETEFTLHAFLWRGIRLEFYDAFGRVVYSMAIYKSLGYIINHHPEGSGQGKIKWEGQNAQVDEFLTEIRIRFTQDRPDAPEGKTRTTTIQVNLGGHNMPAITFSGTHGLGLMQTVLMDCVSFSFDCAEVSLVSFTNLRPRARDWELVFLPPLQQKVTALQQRLEDAPPVPPQVAGQDLAVLIAIMSSPNKFEARLAQRETWRNHPLVLSGHVTFKYFVGNSPSALLRQIVQREADVFGDMDLSTDTEVYVTINFKLMRIFQHFTSPEWTQGDGVTRIIGKTDDDVYIDVSALYSHLLSHKSEGQGYTIFSAKETRQKVSNFWYWPTGETKEYSNGLPPYPTGTFYLMSERLVKAWLKIDEEKAGLASHPMEDRQIGIWIAQLQRTTGQTVAWSHLGGVVNECEAGALVVHHVTAADIACLHSQYVKAGRIACC